MRGGYAPAGASWSELGVHCSLTERRADEATRDVENWLKCYFMQDRVGETFDGTISGVTNFGIFVTLDGLNIDGLVHVTEISRRRVAHAKDVLTVGQEVSVKVTKIENEGKRISLSMKELEKDPWEGLAQRIPPGTPFTKTVLNSSISA